MTNRSFPPLPWRIMSWSRSGSTSCTRTRQHSMSRNPAPYMRPAISRKAPSAPSTASRSRPHLVRTEDRGEPHRPLARAAVDAGQVDAEDVLVEEQEGVERLVLGAGRDVAGGRPGR